LKDEFRLSVVGYLEVSMLELENLTAAERATYALIAKAKDIRPRNLPNRRMIGAVSTLKDKGLIEIYRRYTSISRRKKKKFVRILPKSTTNETGGERPIEF
jgi:hypothetical protein